MKSPFLLVEIQAAGVGCTAHEGVNICVLLIFVKIWQENGHGTKAACTCGVKTKTGRLFKTVPQFFGFLSVVAAFAFFLAFRFVAEQVGADQRFERVVADFAFIVFVFHADFRCE